ncbi:coiled-coil domain-containing protein 81-like [Cyrtonyx montezumae]|uniref:coiled-coil domain-containing protein 81-like n=1 Tax=Cyrtonyx montezumae TaxID=9017 RepID=UPI0032DB3312
MSSPKAVANAEQPACVKRTEIKFWEDGPRTERDYRMPEVTAKGTHVHRGTTGAELPPSPHSERARASTGTSMELSLCGAGTMATLSISHHHPHTPRQWECQEVADAECDLLFPSPSDRIAVWDAVAVYVQQQLLLRKGVRIPTFGSFSIVSKQIEVEGRTRVLHWPAFCLARNLVETHRLMHNKEYLPGHKEVEPLKYSEVAAAASVTRQTGKACIFGTTFLVSHCLSKGENIAFVLKDIGVLLIEGTRVQMKFYYDLLAKITGKRKLEKVVFKVPRLLDMVVSTVAPVASLTSSGRVIVFPM